MDFSFEQITQAITAIRAAIGLIRDGAEALPAGPERDSVHQKLQTAEQKFEVAQAQLAQGFGYELCKCTFPPQIMRSIGYVKHRERFQCPKCEKVWPDPTPRPPMQTDSDSNWLDSRK